MGRCDHLRSLRLGKQTADIYGWSQPTQGRGDIGGCRDSSETRPSSNVKFQASRTVSCAYVLKGRKAAEGIPWDRANATLNSVSKAILRAKSVRYSDGEA